MDYLTDELDYLVKKSLKTWLAGSHEQKRKMVMDAIERARILHDLDKKGRNLPCGQA